MRLDKEIQAWQNRWANENGIPVGPPSGNKLSRATGYVHALEQNLFLPLPDRVRLQLIQGQGGELDSPDGQSGNMYAVYSSSAICLNHFLFWSNLLDEATIASPPKSIEPLLSAFGHPGLVASSIDFEVPCIVNPYFKTPPHLDVQISLNNSSLKKIGIEAKFCEPYGGKKMSGFPPVYLRQSELWKNWPSVWNFAEKISEYGSIYYHFDAAQILKHLLGMRKQYGMDFMLVYLWFDVPGHVEAIRHRGEVDAFTSILKSDGVPFAAMKYQELWAALSVCAPSTMLPYLAYLTKRYGTFKPSEDVCGG